ncbi:MAG: hypothetical protein K9J13_14750, partial [Saprospiraceae bacterium]|nr:hypothetical protein [Saprospiraceae bacterium]
MKINSYRFLFLLILVFIFGCGNAVKDNAELTLNQPEIKQEIPFVNPVGEFLGETPPDTVAEIFAPGIVSTFNDEGNSVFSASGDEFYFTLRTSGAFFKVMQMRKENNIWSKPERAWFSDEESKNSDITMSQDGKKILFVSDRPTFEFDSINDYNIWEMNLIDSVWDKPKPLEINNNSNYMYPTIAKNGNIYFFSDFNSMSSGLDIFLSEYKNGKYEKPKALKEPINTIYHDFDPYISPDESFLIFSSTRYKKVGTGDLYITYNLGNGKWSDAIKLGKG